MRKREWEMPPDVAAVYSEIEEWRTNRTKRTAMPSGIWSSAVELAGRYNVYRISRALRLNYEALKRRLSESIQNAGALSTSDSKPVSRCEFVELSGVGMMPTSSGQGAAASGGDDGSGFGLEMEMCDVSGSRMTVRMSEGYQVDLQNMVSSFWRRSQ
jgi:hypothetical protein